MKSTDYARAVAEAIAAGDHATVAALAVEMAGKLAEVRDRKQAAAERTRKWRENKAPGDVTDSGVTSQASQNVTDVIPLSPLVPPSPLPEPIPSPPYNPPSPDSGESKTRTPRPAKPAVEKPSSWVAELTELWSGSVGDVPHGRMGKALKAAVARHGAPAVRAAMERYVLTVKSTNRAANLQWFANEIAMWVERAAVPLVIDGEMSPELERLTRPDNFRRVG